MGPRFRELTSMARDGRDIARSRNLWPIVSQNSLIYHICLRYKSAMRKIGEKVSDKQVDGMVKEADLDKDGKVNYDEFVKVLVNKI